MGELGNELAAEIRAASARASLRNTELAERSGLPASTVSKLMSGERPFDVDQLSKIAGAVGVESSELMRRAEFALAAKRGAVEQPDLGSQDSDEPA